MRFTSIGRTATTPAFIPTITFGRFVLAMNAGPNAASRYKSFLLLALCLAAPLWARSNSSIRAFNEGVKYFNAKQFSAAIPRFDEAISGDDQFAEAYFARG